MAKTYNKSKHFDLSYFQAKGKGVKVIELAEEN